jgi:hypothetical protein
MEKKELKVSKKVVDNLSKCKIKMDAQIEQKEILDQIEQKEILDQYSMYKHLEELSNYLEPHTKIKYTDEDGNDQEVDSPFILDHIKVFDVNGKLNVMFPELDQKEIVIPKQVNGVKVDFKNCHFVISQDDYEFKEKCVEKYKVYEALKKLGQI